MSKKTPSIRIQRCIAEIRFKENPLILDNRGKWADIVSKKLNFKDWQIGQNRVDVINKADAELGYFSFNNMGYIIENSQSFEDFSVKTTGFIDLVASDKMLGDNLHIKRIGIRTIYCKENGGSFEVLKDNINNNFGGINDKAKKILNVNMEDIGVTFDLSDKIGNIHLVCGPMKENQLKQYFTKLDRYKLPQVGLYVDIDYWIMPNALIKTPQLINTVKDLIVAESNKIAELERIIMGGMLVV